MKSQTAHSDMHRLISATNLQFDYVSLVLIFFTFIPFIMSTVIIHHTFTLSFQAKNISFPKIFSTTDIHTHQPD